MKRSKASVRELKDMIVDLKMENISLRIPYGNCPYAYYNLKREVETCDGMSCSNCRGDFMIKMREKIAKEVADM